MRDVLHVDITQQKVPTDQTNGLWELYFISRRNGYTKPSSAEKVAAKPTDEVSFRAALIKKIQARIFQNIRAHGMKVVSDTVI